MSLGKVIKEENLKHIKKWLILLFVTIIYKVALDYSYIAVLGDKIDEFILDINIYKIIFSSIIIICIFLKIEQFNSKPSVILFNLFFYVEIIPISVIYGCGNMSSFYFATIILGTCICLSIINYDFEECKMRIAVIDEMSVIIPYMGIIIAFLLLFAMVYFLGAPSIDAFDFSKVYDIRLHGRTIDNKIFNYLLNWSTAVIIPMLIARSFALKHYAVGILYIAIAVIFYLYTASKAILFMIPVVVGIYIISKLKNSSYWFTLGLGVGIIGVSVLAVAGKYTLYSYFVRRTLILPAYLKFLYYEFFLMHDKIGLSGTLWGSAAGFPFPYENGLGVEISKYFFNNDVMNSNTGFLAEGFYRGGYIGLICVMILFAFILRLINNMVKRTSFSFAITFSIYPIYSLNDSSLIDSMIFGPMLVFILILLFYCERKMSGGMYEKKTKCRLHKAGLHIRYNKRIN